MAVDFPGLRQNESSSQIINQAQDFPEQASRHGNLGQLEHDVPASRTTDPNSHTPVGVRLAANHRTHHLQ